MTNRLFDSMLIKISRKPSISHKKNMFYGNSADNHQFEPTLKAILRRKETQDGAESSFIESSVKFCIDMGPLTFFLRSQKKFFFFVYL